MGLLLWIVDHPWLCAAVIIAGVCVLAALLCGLAYLATRLADAVRDRDRPAGPRRPPSKPPVLLELLEAERLLLAVPGSGRRRRITTPPRPDGPPPGHVWITPDDPHDADTRELPKIQETAA